MNAQQIEQLLEREAAQRRHDDSAHLASLSASLTADLPSWARRRRVAGTLLALTLLVGLPAAYGTLLPGRQQATLVACNLDGQEEAVLHCANNILT